MERSEVKFRAKQQALAFTSGIRRYASDTVNYVEACFDLQDNWSGFDAVTAVWNNGTTRISTVLDSNGKCRVPQEVLSKRGDVFLNLTGTTSANGTVTERLTSYPVWVLAVDAKAHTKGAETAEITPSQFEQFASNVRADASSARASATAAAASASASAQSASDAAQSAAGALNFNRGAMINAEQAHDSAMAASLSQQEAETAEGNARASEQNASASASEASQSAQSASASAEQASESAGQASASAQSASTDADRAETVRDEAEAARDVAVSAKDTAVNAVEGFEDIVDTATATAVQTIQGEGATQVTAIQTEGTTQVASVRTEGSTQVTAVQDKGDEVLDSIPADYTQLSQNVTDLKSELSDIGVEENTTVVPAPISVGYTINGSGAIVSSAGNYYIYKASVTVGKTYLVTAKNHWSAPFYAYYDSNMDLVEKGTSSEVGATVTSIEDEETIAPASAAFLVTTTVNDFINSPIKEVNGYALPRLDTLVSDVNDLEGDVSDLMNGVTIRNLFSPSKVVSGYYFNGSGTLIADANSEYLDDYIPIDPTETYIASADGLQICTYSSDKTFIERAYNQEDAETPMTFGNNCAFVRISRYGSAFPSGFIFATEKVYSLLRGSYANSNYAGVATKTATTLTVTVGKLKVVINKYNDSTIRAYDLWRTNDAYIRKPNGTFTRLWYNSDSDGVVKIKDEDDFIGGYHGDETQTAFHLFVDGVEYLESATFTDLEFDELVLYSESNVYHCNTSTTPDVIAFKRKKTITFNKDGYIVENYWTAQEALVLIRAYMGMLSIERYTDNTYTDYLLTGYHTNYDYAYVDADTGTGAKPELTKVLFHTIYGDVGIKMDEIKTLATYYGDVTNYNSSYDKRLKAYMANVNSNAGVSISQGAVIKAKATTFAV